MIDWLVTDWGGKNGPAMSYEALTPFEAEFLLLLLPFSKCKRLNKASNKPSTGRVSVVDLCEKSDQNKTHQLTPVSKAHSVSMLFKCKATIGNSIEYFIIGFIKVAVKTERFSADGCKEVYQCWSSSVCGVPFSSSVHSRWLIAGGRSILLQDIYWIYTSPNVKLRLFFFFLKCIAEILQDNAIVFFFSLHLWEKGDKAPPFHVSCIQLILAFIKEVNVGGHVHAIDLCGRSMRWARPVHLRRRRWVLQKEKPSPSFQ